MPRSQKHDSESNISFIQERAVDHPLIINCVAIPTVAAALQLTQLQKTIE